MILTILGMILIQNSEIQNTVDPKQWEIVMHNEWDQLFR